MLRLLIAAACAAVLLLSPAADAQRRGDRGGGGAQHFSVPHFNAPMQRNFAPVQRQFVAPRIYQQGRRSFNPGVQMRGGGRHFHRRGGGWFVVPYGLGLPDGYYMCDDGNDPFYPNDPNCIDSYNDY